MTPPADSTVRWYEQFWQPLGTVDDDGDNDWIRCRLEDHPPQDTFSLILPAVHHHWVSHLSLHMSPFTSRLIHGHIHQIGLFNPKVPRMWGWPFLRRLVDHRWPDRRSVQSPNLHHISTWTPSIVFLHRPRQEIHSQSLGKRPWNLLWALLWAMHRLWAFILLKASPRIFLLHRSHSKSRKVQEHVALVCYVFLLWLILLVSSIVSVRFFVILHIKIE